MYRSLADICERLMQEYDGQVRPDVVVRVVRQAAADLHGQPHGHLPEHVETLAALRLAAGAWNDTTTPGCHAAVP